MRSAAPGTKHQSQSRSFRFAEESDVNRPNIKEVENEKYAQ